MKWTNRLESGMAIAAKRALASVFTVWLLKQYVTGAH
jgi:hypothetical protein